VEGRHRRRRRYGGKEATNRTRTPTPRGLGFVLFQISGIRASLPDRAKAAFTHELASQSVDLATTQL
jgi:hypothetical protein